MFKVINIIAFCAIGFYNFVNLCAVNRFYYNKHNADAIVCIAIKPNVNAIVYVASNLKAIWYVLH
jgi:hypothetical protein